MVKRNSKRRKYFIALAVILLVLIVFRLMLPSLLKSYVNKRLKEIPEYTGYVEDIDIYLFRGAYVIKDLYLNKLDAGSEVHFISIGEADISVEWKSLFRGRIVSEIFLDRASVIYVFEDHQREGGEVEMEDWTKVLTDLVPISINRFEVQRGKLAFVQVLPDPTIDLHINDVIINVSNLQNIIDAENKLPSTLKMEGVSIGGGDLEVEGRLNFLKLIPDMDLKLELENADVTSLNDAFKYYANLDFEKGSFSLYSEIAVADGYLKSYVKPFLSDAKFADKDDKLIKRVWEGLADVVKSVMENRETEKVASKIPIEGDLNNSEVCVWEAVKNLVKNAWIKAFDKGIDGNIEFKDAKKK